MDTTTSLSFPALDTRAAEALPMLRSAIPANDEAPPTEGFELLCLRAGGQEYGLPLRSVQEIRSYQAATPLPGQARTMRGVLDLRGQVIALLDLRRLLGMPEAAPEDALAKTLRAIVVLIQEGRRIGLVVDEVLDVLGAQPGDFRTLPPLPCEDGWLRGIVSVDTRRVLLLRPDAWIHTYAARAA